MCSYEFINMIYNFKSLWNFLCKKKVIRNEIMCPRCKNLLQIVDVSENSVLHYIKKYFIKSLRMKAIKSNM